MNGNSLRLAGLGEKDSAVVFYLREAAKEPLFFALTVLRRLWAVFLFHPLLFLLTFAAAAFIRKEDRFFVSIFPVYFILIHSLFSVEKRYFYPLLYLLPVIMAAPFFNDRTEEDRAQRVLAGSGVAAMFRLLFPAVLGVEALVAAYPARASRFTPGAGGGAAAGYLSENDRTMRELECKELWIKGDDAGYCACLDAFAGKFDDKVSAYFLAVSVSKDPSALPLPHGAEMHCLILRMLREFELNLPDAAMVSFRQANVWYESEHNMVRGTPYAKDREIEALLKRDSETFWSAFVYPRLLMWPPERMSKIISGLSSRVAFDGRLRLLANALEEMRSRKSFSGRQLRLWTAPAVLGLSQGALRSLWKSGEERSVRLRLSAAEKARSGDLKGAEVFLSRALDLELNPDTAEVLMGLCSLRAEEGRKERALKDCQAAAYASYFGAGDAPPLLASEASFQSYQLLRALGRKTEAREVLARTVWNAPDSWPGLAGARAAMRGPGAEQVLQSR